MLLLPAVHWGLPVCIQIMYVIGPAGSTSGPGHVTHVWPRTDNPV
jgi:hypothetical protein